MMGLFRKRNKQDDMYDLLLEYDKGAEKDAQKPLCDSRLEAYARELVDIYERDGETEAMDRTMRPVGEAINDRNEMILVAHRAVFLAEAKGLTLCVRHIEWAWDGIAGWMA